MTAILDFKNVELYYDHVYALKGVSIQVDEGETVALIGANGAGKSSILRAITGLAPIKSGEIHYLGDSMARKPPRLWKWAYRWCLRGVAYSPTCLCKITC